MSLISNEKVAYELGLTPQQVMFADLILDGVQTRDAYEQAGYKGKTSASWSRLLTNTKIRKYLAIRRRERREQSFIDSDLLLEEIANVAFGNVVEIASYQCTKPEDLANLPRDLQMLVKGWKWDKHGNFVLEFEDRSQAREQLMKHFGLYQADATNDKDRGAMLVATALWQFVISLHVTRGLPIEEALRLAEAKPELVQEWGKRQGLLPAGAADAAG